MIYLNGSKLCGHAYGTAFRHKSGRYVCIDCIDKEFESFKTKVHFINSVILMPKFIGSDLIPKEILISNIDSLLENLIKNGKLPSGNDSNRMVGYDYGLLLFSLGKKVYEIAKTIYEKIVNLLISDWDEQNCVNRSSMYSKFFPEDKCRFLRSISYQITTDLKRSVFSSQDLQRVYKKIYTEFKLPLQDSKKIVKELESHTGLILQSAENYYEFSHKSIQEYLCAEHIVRLPEIPDDYKLLGLIPNELAISVSISSNSSQYLSYLVKQRLLHKHADLDSHFYLTFISRLMQENPDLNNSEETIIALLRLYSYCVVKFVHYSTTYPKVDPKEKSESDDLDLESISELEKNRRIIRKMNVKKRPIRPELIVADFAVFIKSRYNKRNLGIIFSDYQVGEVLMSIEADRILTVQRKSGSLNKHLPSDLYLLESFIQ